MTSWHFFDCHKNFTQLSSSRKDVLRYVLFALCQWCFIVNTLDVTLPRRLSLAYWRCNKFFPWPRKLHNTCGMKLNRILFIASCSINCNCLRVKLANLKRHESNDKIKKQIKIRVMQDTLLLKRCHCFRHFLCAVATQDSTYWSEKRRCVDM